MFMGHFPELIIVLIIALVVFGPKRLPELGSSLGKGIREFRKATNELQDSINVNEPLPQERTRYSASAERPASASQTTTAQADYVASTTAHEGHNDPTSSAHSAD
jgi:sec-independent protein translocase protein TatA